MSGTLHLEDLTPGRRFAAGPVAVTEAAIVAFARLYDPQPFHTDPDAAARHPLFQGLAASGWHTAALTMPLVIEAIGAIADGVVGSGGELRWRRPVRPGDRLSVEIEVLEAAPSRSRPGTGSVVLRILTLNQHGEEVQSFTPRLTVPRRPA